MLLTLRSDHKEHLLFLASQPNPVIENFCKLTSDYLNNGINEKLCKTAAEKLQVPVENIHNCIYGLVNLLLICYKHDINEVNFRDSILTLGFSSEQVIILYEFYKANSEDLIKALKNLSLNEPHYNNLEWRFEILVSSRSLQKQVNPLITFDLSRKMPSEEQKIEHTFLQTDPTNLQYITNELERALNESRSKYSRKIQQAILK